MIRVSGFWDWPTTFGGWIALIAEAVIILGGVGTVIAWLVPATRPRVVALWRFIRSLPARFPLRIAKAGTIDALRANQRLPAEKDEVELRPVMAANEPGEGYDARLAIRNLGATAVFVVRGRIVRSFNDPNIVPNDVYLLPWADTNGGTEDIEIPHDEERSLRVAGTVENRSQRLVYLQIWSGNPHAYIGTVKSQHDVRWDPTDRTSMPFYEIELDISRGGSVVHKSIWVTAKGPMGPAEVRLSGPIEEKG